jgi:DUF4097 and DUF4098 domain-containing protein YvlB
METSAFSNAMNKPMNRLKFYSLYAFAVIVILTFGAQLLTAQAADNNRITVPLTDPARSAQVRAHLVSGSITVKAYEGKDVIVEAKTRGDEDDEEKHEKRREGNPQGNLHRIPMNSTGLNVEAENNQVRVSTDSYRHAIDLTLTVPVHTSLSLHTVNNGNITVSGVDGELDVNNVNGEVTLKNISGSAVAHALNGKVLVTFNRLDPQKPMAFSSLNGDIDVTFPADIKATLSMRTDNGEVYSDFDVQLQTTAPQQTTDDGRGKGGKYVVRVEKTVKGTINGGGQEIQLKNFNGNIYIRKAGGK